MIEYGGVDVKQFYFLTVNGAGHMVPQVRLWTKGLVGDRDVDRTGRAWVDGGMSTADTGRVGAFSLSAPPTVLVNRLLQLKNQWMFGMECL